MWSKLLFCVIIYRYMLCLFSFNVVLASHEKKYFSYFGDLLIWCNNPICTQEGGREKVFETLIDVSTERREYRVSYNINIFTCELKVWHDKRGLFRPEAACGSIFYQHVHQQRWWTNARHEKGVKEALTICIYCWMISKPSGLIFFIALLTIVF